MIYKLTPQLSVGGEVDYSPNYNNSGARAVNMAGQVTVELMPFAWTGLDSYYVWGKFGRMQFGNVSSALGGYQLPNYNHWLVGLGFKKEPFTLELNYTNTSLSRENCFIQTGDPAASPGGLMTDANPLGLRSNWCSPAVYAKLSFGFSTEKKK